MPIVLFLKTTGDPKIKLSFQVDHLGKSDYEIGTNLNFITFYLKELLTQKLKIELGHAINLVSTFGTLRKYSFLNVDVTLSELGRKYTNRIISTVLSGIQEVKDKYSPKKEFFTEFKGLTNMEFWLTPSPSSPQQLSETIAERIDRVGINGAISDLTDFGNSLSKITQEDIFKWLNVENMRVVVFEDFGVEPTAKNTNMYDPIDLGSSFETFLGKPASLSDEGINSNVVLDQWHDDYKTFYHFQIVDDPKLIQKWKDTARSVKFGPYQKNQFLLSEKFMRGIKNRKTRNYVKNSIEYLNDDLKMAFYKFNENYAHKQTYLQISFKIQKDFLDSLGDNTKSQALTEVISNIWKKNLIS